MCTDLAIYLPLWNGVCTRISLSLFIHVHCMCFIYLSPCLPRIRGNFTQIRYLINVSGWRWGHSVGDGPSALCGLAGPLWVSQTPLRSKGCKRRLSQAFTARLGIRRCSLRCSTVVGRRPECLEVTGSTPGEGSCLGLELNSREAGGSQSCFPFVNVSHSLSCPLSKINKNTLKYW